MASMSGVHKTEVVLEVHRSKDNGAYQISISELDETGAGGGYRLYGPKFCACHGSELLARTVLDKRDAEELIRYAEAVC